MDAEQRARELCMALRHAKPENHETIIARALRQARAEGLEEALAARPEGESDTDAYGRGFNDGASAQRQAIRARALKDKDPT